MNTPERFKLGTEEAIHNAIGKGAWTLVLTADDTSRTNHLIELCDDDTVQTALANFKCFMIYADSEIASGLEIHSASSLSVFVESDTPQYTFKLEYPDETDTDDIILFLEKTTEAIESGEENQDYDD